MADSIKVFIPLIEDTRLFSIALRQFSSFHVSIGSCSIVCFILRVPDRCCILYNTVYRCRVFFEDILSRPDEAFQILRPETLLTVGNLREFFSEAILDGESVELPRDVLILQSIIKDHVIDNAYTTALSAKIQDKIMSAGFKDNTRTQSPLLEKLIQHTTQAIVMAESDHGYIHDLRQVYSIRLAQNVSPMFRGVPEKTAAEDAVYLVLAQRQKLGIVVCRYVHANVETDFPTK